MSVNVVIGANYGDEGKGLVVDALTNLYSQTGFTAVVRFNGGAQAGHTVITPYGTRHVFSHVGAGLLAGAGSILSRFFVVNPVVLFHELTELSWMSPLILPLGKWVAISDQCMVTNHYDVFLNREMERQRGSDRHGSCGLGFGETIQRYESRMYSLTHTIGELIKFSDLQWRQFFAHMRAVYVPHRLRLQGFVFNTAARERMEAECDDDLFIERFREIVNHRRVMVVPNADLFKGADHLIFEGAQGLLLDMDKGEFPHVTRSNTGIKNVLTVLAETGYPVDDVTVSYVTRGYLTRHGAGPLLDEGPLSGVIVEDRTNIDNPWQGNLRFAPLRIATLVQRTQQDFEQKQFHAACNLMVTCCDQFEDPRLIDPTLQALKNCGKFDEVYASYGPTRATLSLL
jgi:adenylosuccinate synthase